MDIHFVLVQVTIVVILVQGQEGVLDELIIVTDVIVYVIIRYLLMLQMGVIKIVVTFVLLIVVDMIYIIVIPPIVQVHVLFVVLWNQIPQHVVTHHHIIIFMWIV
jgi:hypothetical protein